MSRQATLRVDPPERKTMLDPDRARSTFSVTPSSVICVTLSAGL
jgi:hypothetical protein